LDANRERSSSYEAHPQAGWQPTHSETRRPRSRKAEETLDLRHRSLSISRRVPARVSRWHSSGRFAPGAPVVCSSGTSPVRPRKFLGDRLPARGGGGGLSSRFFLSPQPPPTEGERTRPSERAFERGGAWPKPSTKEGKLVHFVHVRCHRHPHSPREAAGETSLVLGRAARAVGGFGLTSRGEGSFGRRGSSE